MSNEVHSVGPKDARIFIVGEAPGAEEEAAGVPFVGGAGRILDGMLKQALISRDSCRIGNIMQERPLGNDFGHFYIDTSRRVPSQGLLDGIARIRREVQEVNPNIVVLLGNEPLKALASVVGITKWRGSILRGATGHKCIPTFHPAAIMRQWDWHALALLDLKKVKEQSLTPDFPPNTRTAHTRPSFDESVTWLNELLLSKAFSFDIESRGEVIDCIGFATSSYEAFCIPFLYNFNQDYFTTEQEVHIYKLLKKLLESPIPKIAQNSQFDCVMIKRHFKIDVNAVFLDTMLAHHICYAELPKGLDTICSIYTDQPFYKDMIKQGGDENRWRYNCLDAMVTFEAGMELIKEMRELEVHSFYYEQDHALLGPVMHMQEQGVRIDVKMKGEALKQLREESSSLQTELSKIIGHEVNVNSPKQMTSLLYDELGLPVQYNRTSGNRTADEEAIKKISKLLIPQNVQSALELVLKIRHNEKLCSTYLEAPVDGDERIRSAYNIGGTETGRLSSSASIFGTGTNLQNIPKGVARKIFIPDAGRIMVQADLSQAEARVVAYLAQERKLMEIFESGQDVFKLVAHLMFNKPVESITEAERYNAKRVVHASNYGMGPRKFSVISGLNERSCNQLLEGYHATFPGIRLWHRVVEGELARSRTLVTPFGRKRIFFGRWGDDLFREGYAFVPQSTVADLLNRGLMRVFYSLHAECDILLQVHDAIVIQTDTRDLQQVPFVDRLAECLLIPIPIFGKQLYIPVDISIGKNWDEVEKFAKFTKKDGKLIRL